MKTALKYIFAALVAALSACADMGEIETQNREAARALSPIQMAAILPKDECPQTTLQIKNAMLLAAKEHNQSEAEKPSKISLFFIDTDGSKEQFQTAVAALKARGAAAVHAGYTSQCAFELKRLESMGALVNFFSQYPPAAAQTKNGVRIFLNGAQVCEEMAKEIPAASPLEKKTLIIIAPDTVLGKSCAEYLKYETGSLNLKIFSESFSPREKDFALLAKNISENKIDYALVFAPEEEQRRDILNALAAAGYKGKVFANCALQNSGFQAPKNLDLKTVKSAFAKSPCPDSERFKAAYEKEYGQAPGLAAALAYDAVKISALALLQSGKDPARAKEFLLKKSFAGAAGKIEFDSDGDAKIPLELSR
ncbi:MAG: ABC transporter substrate-binding protein [Opitutales bacterium]|nr:ABC transporter substrate-binding protein [Opitutales bacterium]